MKSAVYAWATWLAEKRESQNAESEDLNWRNLLAAILVQETTDQLLSPLFQKLPKVEMKLNENEIP